MKFEKELWKNRPVLYIISKGSSFIEGFVVGVINR